MSVSSHWSIVAPTQYWAMYIQFIVEEESEGRMLQFPDVELCWDFEWTVTTLIYWKTTHTNQHLSLASHHPLMQKVVVVSTLMSRANTLSSSGVQWVKEEKNIVDALKEDGYPSSFIHKHSCLARHRQEGNDRRPRTTVTLPYINDLSVRRILHGWTSRWSLIHWAPSVTCKYTPKTQYHCSNRRVCVLHIRM